MKKPKTKKKNEKNFFALAFKIPKLCLNTKICVLCVFHEFSENLKPFTEKKLMTSV